MKCKEASFFKNTFLFRGIVDGEITNLLSDIQAECICYRKGDCIYSPESFDRRIGFVLEGECIVGRPSTNSSIVPLNTLRKHGSFGIMTLFSSHAEFPTVITAKSDCSVLFLNGDDVMRLIEKKHAIALNIITFLTERIAFLNERIASFSGNTVEENLVSYILSMQKRCGANDFEFNKKRIAEAINCGRASLYRAIDTLINGGLVKFVGKKIYILDREGLEGMLK